jgi:transcriptional regulator GlxA family with amidase domain
LQEAATYADLIRIVECFVHQLVQKAPKEPLRFDVACKQMIKHFGNLSIAWLAKESCYCSKQFNRTFKERVGLNPKTYAKILRFNRAFNIRNRFPDQDWCYIAAKCGYVDYQHLAKDYTDFTGFTPAIFHLLESKSPERVLGLTKNLYMSRYLTS